MFQARASGFPNLEFVVPEEGVMHWTDNMMIPMHAANPQSAMMWMDFYYQPEVAARVAEWVNYITPVPDAKGIIAGQFGDQTVAGSPLVFPTPDINGPRLPGVPGQGRVRHLERASSGRSPRTAELVPCALVEVHGPIYVTPGATVRQTGDGGAGGPAGGSFV